MDRKQMKKRKTRSQWKTKHETHRVPVTIYKRIVFKTKMTVKISIWPKEDMLPSYFSYSYILLLLSKCRAQSRKELTGAVGNRHTSFLLGQKENQACLKHSIYRVS